MSELIDYGVRVASGEVQDPHFHLTFYTAPPDADPWSPKTWKLANPALGDFRSLEDVKRLAAQARRMPSAQAAFENLILNRRVDVMSHFIEPSVWKQCGAPIDFSHLEGKRCHAALDLGATKDLSALVLVFGDETDGFDVVPHVWLPGNVEEAVNRDRGTPYALWIRQGHLFTFPGRASTDPKAVALRIAELHGRYNIEALAFDRWRIEDLRRELDDIGCDVKLVEHGQGFRDMAPAVDKLERLVVERKIRHANHPLLAMAVTNATIEADAANNRKFTKKRSTGRIDPIVALAMALAISSTPSPPEPKFQMMVLGPRRM